MSTAGRRLGGAGFVVNALAVCAMALASGDLTNGSPAGGDLAPRGAAWPALAVGGFLGFALLDLAGAALLALVRRQRHLPVLARGLPLGVVVPPAPPAVFAGRSADLWMLTGLGLPAGLAVGWSTGSWTLAWAVPSGAATLRVLTLLPLLASVVAMRKLPPARLRDAVREAVAAVDLRVVAYFGGTAPTAYRAESWLATLERLGEPVLVVLRDRTAFAQLGSTRLPVVYAHGSTDLTAVLPPELALALYVSLDANNTDLRRRRGCRHVYLGHGDSDRPESTSPLLIGFDEVWVAGPAGRDRAVAAGVDERRVATIGRPQLDGHAAPPEPIEYPLLIVYAPTIPDPEGPPQCSLATFGVDLVRWLVAEPDVCVVYRPHPLVELAEPDVRRAHHRILELLGRDACVPEPADLTPRARDALASTGAAPGPSATERIAALEVWTRKQLLAARTEQRHLYAPSPRFQLRTVADVADGLIGDVSGVITDYLVTGKPYAVTNPADRADYAQRHPSVTGGYIVTPDGRGLDELLAAARRDGDALRSTRMALRERLLGPAQPPALERMRTQVRRHVPQRPRAYIPAPAADTSADALGKV